ncbi:MAG: transglutaminase domain-containing protein [Calditrichaeota bacterium]|nr:transglutaminase domain-containing protein [Calditrichota bacterium]RQW04599.1 MAG: transglutaminase domain-containing protein [Calditrichota bacterium]
MMDVKIRSIILYLGIFIIFSWLNCQTNPTEKFIDLIDSGEFTEAGNQITEYLETENNLSAEQREILLFELERMDRIEKDFKATRSDVLDFIREYIPDVTEKDIIRWENEKSLEYMIIDGQKRYFNRAARNLFRIDSSCIRIWKETHPEQSSEKKFDLDQHISDVMAQSRESSNGWSTPVRIKVKYTITIPENTVPRGETIRCWIPYPREITDRQVNIEYLSSEPEQHVIAPPQYLQRTIYFEKQTVQDNETEFLVEYAYTSHGFYKEIQPEKIQNLTTEAQLNDFLREEPPHILFSDELKALSNKIVGGEENPYRIARLLYTWVDQNIPWASAREYSTIRNISEYCLQNRHGDCGIKALFYITLLRLNGIPARWQSGWEFQPPHHNMHDWGMLYFEPYGWMPMDVDYGMRTSENESKKYFYLNGMDSYRLVFNDAISQEFFPPKKHFRSETIDSQRGEIEWDGGNLYFDQWDWNIEFEVID